MTVALSVRYMSPPMSVPALAPSPNAAASAAEIRERPRTSSSAGGGGGGGAASSGGDSAFAGGLGLDDDDALSDLIDSDNEVSCRALRQTSSKLSKAR